ncbi:MAG: hypothetical protein IPK26_13450 [Planctomycetes bacterium]|nr:hypothetical protein [Planctomycetota bacterium]
MSFHLFRNVLVAAALLTTSLTAQYSRSGSYVRSIGNSWLGGSVNVSASLTTTTTTSTRTFATTRAANANLTANVNASVLTRSLNAARLTCIASNRVTTSQLTPTTQSANAAFRLQLAGYTVWDRSVTTTGSLGGIPARTYNLFPTDPSAPVGVGPFTITLSGNAGVTLGAGASVILPTTAPEVRLLLSGNTAIVGRARVSVGAVGFYAGLELQARFAEQRLTVSLIVNALNGLSGMCDYQIQAISLRLIAYLEAFWTRVYSTTLVSWGSGYVGRDLLNL